MTSHKYVSLDDIRVEKHKVKLQVEQAANRLKHHITDSFMPANPAFVNSSSKYLNYVGYAISAYKVFMTARKVMRFFSK